MKVISESPAWNVDVMPRAPHGFPGKLSNSSTWWNFIFCENVKKNPFLLVLITILK